MIEVLKVLAGKVNGTASIVAIAMILVYLLGTATLVNSLYFCIGIITFLAVLFLLGQLIKKSNTEEKSTEEK